MLLSHFKPHAFKLDYMRIKFEFDTVFDQLSYLCSYLDDDNSNWCVKWWFDWQIRIERSGDYYMIKPVDFPISIMRVNFKMDFEVEIDFYGAFFSWEGNEDLHKFLSPSSHRIMRVDLALDLVGCTPTTLEKCGDFKLPRGTVKDCQTIYYGDQKSNRKIVRMYDKKQATKDLGKEEVDFKILEYKEPVTRLEIEMRSACCKEYGFTLERLRDIEYCWKIFYKELTTKYIYFTLPPVLYDTYAKPTFEKGTPNPVLRFQEAIEQAIKKNVDVLAEVMIYCK